MKERRRSLGNGNEASAQNIFLVLFKNGAFYDQSEKLGNFPSSK